MLKKFATLCLCSSFLTSCQGAGIGMPVVSAPESAVVQQAPVVYAKPVNPIAESNEGLEAWWSFFGDSTLADFISSALSMNAVETSKKPSFPKGDGGIDGYKEYYKSPRVDLVKEVIKGYVEYRYVQNQSSLLDDYVSNKEDMLGDASYDDSELVKKELEALKVKKQDFQKQMVGITEDLARRTKLLPEYVEEILRHEEPLPVYNMTPLLASSSRTLANSSDIKAARTWLSFKTNGQVGTGQTQKIFPNLPISKMFGISDEIYAMEGYPKRISIGKAKEYIDFGSIKGLSGFTREKIEFTDSVSGYVTEIESLLVTIGTLHQQQVVLERAAIKAHSMDVYKTRLASLKAKYEIDKNVISLFDKLDLY